VFDVERFALDDGPGIRTVVFFKGCPLKCTWCCNPESQSRSTEVAYSEKKCIRCGKCAIICPKHAIRFSGSKGYQINREQCDACGLCAEICPSKAKEIIGRYVTVREIMDDVKKDAIFYRRTGGGVTLSGGEPLIQSAFAKELLEACKSIGLSTAIETCGYASWANFEMVKAHTDLFYYDLKLMGDELHKKCTGVSNKLVLENLKKLSTVGTPIIVRVPLIPGINDSLENFRAIGSYSASLGANVREIQILPYHALGIPKYEKIGRICEVKSLGLSEERSLEQHMKIIEGYGLKAVIGGR